VIKFSGKKTKEMGKLTKWDFDQQSGQQRRESPHFNRLVVYKKGPKMGCSPKSTTIFFGYFGPFGGSHPKNPAILGIVTSLQAGWSWFYRCVHSGEREILSNSCGPFLFEA